MRYVTARMIDENAFGILVSYFKVEDDEYTLERDAFVERFQKFRYLVRACIRDVPLGRDVRAADLGHALYLEVAQGDQSESPLAWARKVRARLNDEGFESVVAVTHGGRWVDESESWTATEHVGDVGLVTLSNPSEPLRRALYADAASRLEEVDPELDEEEDEDDEGSDALGWGAGLYLDTEAAEALGMVPKNAPTVLRAAGATFYRAGR
jgi:hypothetical protein